MKRLAGQLLREAFATIAPIGLTVALLHVTFIPLGEGGLERFLVAALFVGTGIALFLAGVRIGLVPLGEFIGAILGRRGSRPFILLTGFLLGAVVTAADPDAQVLTTMVTSIMPEASAHVIVTAVSLGVGALVAVSFLRVFLNIPMPILLFGLYVLLFALSFFVPPALVPVAFDAGGVTTGPVLTPFIMALSVGVAADLSKGDPLADSFGLVALACVGPVLALLLLALFR